MDAAEVNWKEYFQRIKKQCPWSQPAWKKGLIDITLWKGTVYDLKGYSARVYTCDLSRSELEHTAALLDEDETYEWLWSEPTYGSYATPVPCLIQQWRSQLEQIRNASTKS